MGCTDLSQSVSVYGFSAEPDCCWSDDWWVGFPHSAHFILIFHVCRAYQARTSRGFVSHSASFCSPSSFSHLQWLCSTPSLNSLPFVLHMCPHVYVCWQPGRCVQVFPVSLNIMQARPCSQGSIIPFSDSCLSWWTHLELRVNTMHVETYSCWRPWSRSTAVFFIKAFIYMWQGGKKHSSVYLFESHS